MKLVGQGANWEVHKLDDETHVFRVPIGSVQHKIKEFLNNHRLIKELGLPTLLRVERHEINGVVGIICENINASGDQIYVTHNSLYSDSRKVLDYLSKSVLGKKPDKTLSEAEEYRYRNKIDEVTNLKEFILNVKVDLELATKSDVLINFDGYFFGSQKTKSKSSLDYMLIDLDHIDTNTGKNYQELLSLNFSEFYNAIHGFVKYFVTETNQTKYIQLIKQELICGNT